jgi:hypothetical protein
VFYVLVAAIPLAAAAALVSFARVVDSTNAGDGAVRARAQSFLVSLVLAVLVFAAALSSPLT